MANGKFPGPYQNDTKLDRSMMEYINFDKMDIGARKSGMPSSVGTEGMSLEHVGGSTGKGM